MDAPSFDGFTRTLAAGWPRRSVMSGLAGAAAMLAGGAGSVVAACKKVGKKCDKDKDCCDGAKCQRDKCKCENGFSNCDKLCFDLDSDGSHCGDCAIQCGAGETCCDGGCADVATDHDHCGSCGHACGLTETCVAGVCTTADGCPVGADACAGERVICSGDFDCVCSQSTEGETICGDLETPGAVCGQCESSADCASLGAGAFCVATGSIECCGPSAQNVCRLPCGAAS